MISLLDCEKYNLGEAAVKPYLEDQGYTVVDVSKDSAYWVQDVDFIAIKGNDAAKIEVKYDNYINHFQSFFVELLADEQHNRAGWLDTTKADLIYYVDAKSLDCFIMRPDDLREYVAGNDYKVKRCYKDGYKVSVGAIVPIADFAQQYPLDCVNVSTKENV